MKIITYSKIGYNAPSQANWTYGIWKVDVIDTKESNFYESFTVLENFGGNYRFKETLKDRGIKVVETRGVYTKTGTPKITGIAGMKSMDSEEFINEIIARVKN